MYISDSLAPNFNCRLSYMLIHEMCCIYISYIYSNYVVLVPIRYAVDEVDAALICIVSLCLCN